MHLCHMTSAKNTSFLAALATELLSLAILESVSHQAKQHTTTVQTKHKSIIIIIIIRKDIEKNIKN